MRTIIENLALCEECTQAAVNADFSGLDYSYNAEESEQRYQEITAGLERLGAGLCYDSTREADEFSTRPCDCCNSRLAGGRDYFIILGE